MTTAPTPALLPCPFCGGPASAHEVNPKEAPGWVHLTVAHTPDCFSRVPKETLLLGAADLERWNRRAELEARKPPPVSVERLDELWASQRSFHGGEPLKMGHVEFARLIEAEYGVLGRIPMREENGGQIDHSLIASREVVADGPVRVTRLHLTEEGRAALTSKAARPLPGITGGSS